MIKVQDVVYCVFRTPDVERLENFLVDFGMAENGRIGDRIFMRGAGPYPYINVIERGPAAFTALGMLVESETELEEAAGLPGASPVEAIDAPGGGKRVRILGPDDIHIDLVHGIEPVSELDVRAPLAVNYASHKQRIYEFQRPAYEPARVVRFGHCVLKFTDADSAGRWFRETLGMLLSDRLHLPTDPTMTMGNFLRCDRGSEPSDHHAIFAVQGRDGDIGLQHTAYEVQDLEAIHIGNRWMKSKKHLPEWGVGRHLFGSQVFDYWRSPDGYLFEHYADGDVLPQDYASGDHPATEENMVQWGPELPPTFFDTVRSFETASADGRN